MYIYIYILYIYNIYKRILKTIKGIKAIQKLVTQTFCFLSFVKLLQYITHTHTGFTFVFIIYMSA